MEKLENTLNLIQKGRYNEALESFNLLINNPEYKLDVLGNRAWLYRSLGRYEEALEDYEELIKENPEDTNAAALKAETRMLMGQLKKAAKESVEVLQKEPFNSLAIEVLTNCKKALGLIENVSVPNLSFEENTKTFRSINPAVDELEKNQTSFKASVYPEVGRFLYEFVRCYKPHLVIEIGSYIGYSALCIGQAFKENGFGHLHSFDLFLDIPGYKSPIIGECSDTLMAARSHIEKAELSHCVTFYKGDSSKTINKVFGNKEICFDLAFIDGDHRICGVLKDWQAIDSILTEGGFVLLHDTNPEGSGWLGPRYLLDELCKRENTNYQWVNLPTPEGHGLAIIQKLSSKDSEKWFPSFFEVFTEWLFLKLRWKRE